MLIINHCEWQRIENALWCLLPKNLVILPNKPENVWKVLEALPSPVENQEIIPLFAVAHKLGVASRHKLEYLPTDLKYTFETITDKYINGVATSFGGTWSSWIDENPPALLVNSIRCIGFPDKESAINCLERIIARDEWKFLFKE